MRVYKIKVFARFARAEGIADQSLMEAIGRAEKGLIDADLGGGLIKQRVARQGQGRSGGFRTLIAFRTADLAVFLYGFAKSDEANINERDLVGLREIARAWLSADAKVIKAAVEGGKLMEVDHD